MLTFWDKLMSFFSLSNLTSNLNDGRTVVVNAHTDDEVLWHEPFLRNSMAMIWLGTPPSQSVYNFAQSTYGSPTGVYGKAIPIYYGWAPMTNQAWYDSAVYDRCGRDATYSYQVMYNVVKPMLQSFRNQGMKRVLTHNPWGEYGHPHHRLICNVIRAIGVELKIDVWHNAVTKPGVDNIEIPYYDALFLDKVTYTKNYVIDFNILDTVRTGLKNTTFIPSGSTTPYDWWTWDDINPNGYPTGNRKYFRSVTKGVDLIAKYPSLNTQIERIKANPAYPYPNGDPNSVYRINLLYTC